MRRAAFAGRAPSGDHQTPIAELNITPLIDVMLVLLVMFILLVPTLTHEVPLDLPQPGPVSSLPIETHRLVLARDGATSLDGQALDGAALATRLHALAGQRQAVLTMRTDSEARYERFDQVLATVKRAGITRLGFEGNVELRW